jgi:DNA primase
MATTVDRTALLARVDLVELAEELLGPGRGRGRWATWRCPAPQHGDQTGATPPVTIFAGRDGLQRYHCHACGAGGTAIDLVMAVRGTSVRDAIEELADRAGCPPHEPRPRPARHESRRAEPRAAPPDPAVEAYVSACEHQLWTPRGEPVRSWLRRRGLDDDVLAANRVGADPGPRFLARPAGLPHRGSAAVFPALADTGRAIYLQARYLDPGRAGRKYDNPSEHLAVNPRVASLRAQNARDDVLLVCEGIPDGLVAVQAGFRAAVVLGAGLPSPSIASELATLAGDVPIVLAFDADTRGRAGTTRLAELLAGHARRVGVLEVPERHGDLNAWLIARGPRYAVELGSHVARALNPRSPIVRRPRAPSRELARDLNL